MKCKSCGKEICTTHVICNSNAYCDEDCMRFDLDYYSKDIDESNDDFESIYGLSIKDAYDILIRHNMWRRDNHVPNQYEMVNPTDLGKAIDVAIEVLKKYIT
jgi:hypothetical protein